MRRLGSLLALLSAPALAAGPGGAAPAAAAPRKLWTDGSRVGVPASAPLNLTSFVKLARGLGPAVVNISTVQIPTVEGGGLRSRVTGLGTGFVIEKSGYLLTNFHVIERAETIRVRLADEREYPARVIGRDELTDLAVIKIDPAADLPVAPLGDSDKLEIGEWVVAIGNPFGLDHTVTAGIVSAKQRRDVRPGGPPSPEGAPTFYDFLQTDASINVGNSGGPLINVRGEVIGINTAMNAQGQGIAFAIPINIAKALIPTLVAHGRAPRSWLGLYPQPVTATLQKAFSLPDTRGALVSEVVAAGPAALAGIAAGDTITAFDGHPIRRADDLQWLVGFTGGGRPVPITLRRAGRTLQVSATLLASRPGEAELPPSVAPARKPSPIGFTVAEVSEAIARELKLPEVRGVVVTGIESDSPAAEAGLERGDLVVSVGDTSIERLEDYGRAIRSVDKGALLKLLVRRDHRALWIAFPRR